jgi:mersacidin/lichenicidin family type 2 lantibiotic
MAAIEVIKAWKDEEYREKLTTEQKAQLPEHPAGLIEFEKPEFEDETPLKAGVHKFTRKTCTH